MTAKYLYLHSISALHYVAFINKSVYTHETLKHGYMFCMQQNICQQYKLARSKTAGKAEQNWQQNAVTVSVIK